MALFWVLCLGVTIPLFYSFCLLTIADPNFFINLVILAVLVWACCFFLYHTLKGQENDG